MNHAMSPLFPHVSVHASPCVSAHGQFGEHRISGLRVRPTAPGRRLRVAIIIIIISSSSSSGSGSIISSIHYYYSGGRLCTLIGVP